MCRTNWAKQSAGVKKVNKGRMQVEGGGWCEREFEEAGEELVKVRCTHGDWEERE